MAVKLNVSKGNKVYYLENGESDRGIVEDVATANFTDPEMDIPVRAGEILVKWDDGEMDWHQAEQLGKL